MPRDTQPQTPDQLYARAIFTAEEVAALTPDDRVMLDDDLLAQLDYYRTLGWQFDVENITTGTTPTDGGQTVFWKQVSAWPYGVEP